MPAASVALPVNALQGTGGEPEISPDADISPGAMIGPGCRIGSGVVVEQGASVWNSLLEDCRIGADSTVERTTIVNSSVGAGCTIRSCVLDNAQIGDKVEALSATIAQSELADLSRLSAFADVRDVQAACGSILGGQVHGADIQSHLMAMHMAGGCEHFKTIPTGVKLEGMDVLIPAVGMIGGGAVIRGTAQSPVLLECSFIGSNAIIEAGCYVGFGCFVLGRLPSDTGLLPFTTSLGPDTGSHRIGGVLGGMASVILTHFVSWAYHATGYDLADAVAQLPRQAIVHGIAAIEWELARRKGNPQADSDGFERYKTMTDYCEAQLLTGLDRYTRSLESGAWEMAYRDGQLTFTSPKGNWVEKDGSAFWKKSR